MTTLWLCIYGFGTVMFFAVSFWVIFRGGKDVIEILTEARDNTSGSNKR